MPRRKRRDSSSSVAATRNGAAELGSDGTVICSSFSRSAGQTEISLLRREIRTPAWRSMRSVWSRVATGSTTTVGPSLAYSPASRMHDFTWAEATGSV